MEARIQELEQKILRQEGLKNQWMKIAGENHSDDVPKSVVHRDLDQKDLEIKAANDAFQAMKKSHDESFQTAMTLQGERDRAQKEVEDLERLVKEFTEEKANLLIKDLERKKELEDHELRLQNLQKQYDNLGKLVTRHCRVFFGEQHDLNNATPEECLGVLASKILDAAGGTLALMKNLSPDDQVPSSVGGILEILYKVPEVVDWTRRSACRRGATAALSILTSHYGEQVDLPCITGGYAPSASGRAASTVEIAAELTRCAPYADRVLSMVKLDIHQASQLAPKDKGKAPATSVDAAKVKLFAAAREGALTSYPGNDQVAREELQTHVKLPEDILGAFASSSS